MNEVTGAELAPAASGQALWSAGLAPQMVEDLVRVGLVALPAGESGKGAATVDDGLRPFLPLLRRYAPRLVPMEREGSPVWFCTGILDHRSEGEGVGGLASRRIPAGGQGETARKAALSCLGELAERVSLCTLGAADPRVRQVPGGQPEVGLAALAGLSAAQAGALVERLGAAAGRGADASAILARMSARRVDIRNIYEGKSGQVSSLAVLFGEAEQAIGQAAGLVSTVGCAVWPTPEGARARALLELAERDAVALAWHNRLGITSIDDAWLRGNLAHDVYDHVRLRSRVTRLFALQTDLAAHVVIAFSWENQAGKENTGARSAWRCAFGSAAAYDLASAGRSALEELLQSENALDLMEKAHPQDSGATARVPRQLAYARSGNLLRDLPLAQAQPLDLRRAQQVFSHEDLLASCATKGADIWEFDATRPDLGIPCIKLLSPDLCTWEARFGRSRFYGEPSSRRHGDPAVEAELAARPFPF